jgi:hypothetical protein
MMLAVNGWRAALAAFLFRVALAALLFFVPCAASSAEDLPGVARILARRTAVFAPGPVALTYRNFSSLPDTSLAQVRSEFEAALPAAPQATPAAEARLTLSENAAEYLLVEEIRKGEESQVWMAAWKGVNSVPASNSGFALDRRLVWQQEDPILDIAFFGDSMAVLGPTKLTIYEHQGAEWRPRQIVALPAANPASRDPRGRLQVNGGRIRVFLPGVQCSGVAGSELAIECHATDEPWVLESGTSALLLANYVPGRNYFDGRLTLQNGSRRSVSPFYSAAAAEDHGTAFWLLAMLDARTLMFNETFQELTSIAGWGSDIAGTGVRCAQGAPVLATSPSDAGEPDALQAYSIANRVPIPLGTPAPFPGPITALWPSTATSVLAVARNPRTGKYEAYVVTVICSP